MALQVKNTFFNLLELVAEVPRRAHSAPPSLGSERRSRADRASQDLRGCSDGGDDVSIASTEPPDGHLGSLMCSSDSSAYGWDCSRVETQSSSAGLRVEARCFAPRCAGESQVYESRAALLSSPLVSDVEVTVTSWFDEESTKPIARLSVSLWGGSDASTLQAVIALAQSSLLIACSQSQDTLLLGEIPFQMLEQGDGFTSTLAQVSPERHNSELCWEVHVNGFCASRDSCHWFHPENEDQTQVYVQLEILGESEALLGYSLVSSATHVWQTSDLVVSNYAAATSERDGALGLFGAASESALAPWSVEALAAVNCCESMGLEASPRTAFGPAPQDALAAFYSRSACEDLAAYYSQSACEDSADEDSEADSVEVTVGTVALTAEGSRGWTRTADGYWQPCRVAAAAPVARLSDYMTLRHAETSVGSLGHSEDDDKTCRVCAFFKKGPGVCRKGSMCEYCHSKHTPYRRRAPHHQKGGVSTPVLRTAAVGGADHPPSHRGGRDRSPARLRGVSFDMGPFFCRRVVP